MFHCKEKGKGKGCLYLACIYDLFKFGFRILLRGRLFFHQRSYSTSCEHLPVHPTHPPPCPRQRPTGRYHDTRRVLNQVHVIGNARWVVTPSDIVLVNKSVHVCTVPPSCLSAKRGVCRLYLYILGIPKIGPRTCYDVTVTNCARNAHFSTEKHKNKIDTST